MQISANRIAIEVEDHGPAAGEPLLLVMGLGMQLVAWPAGLVAMLVGRGFRVIRFDNRDIGLSQSFDQLGVPNILFDAVRYSVGMKIDSPYSLADMADDTAGVLDALGIATAHVCGASMGGMIVQRLAAQHPKRVKSLTLMMTSSGARRLPGPSLKVRGAMMMKPGDPRDIESIVDRYVHLLRTIGSPDYAMPDAELRDEVRAVVRRSYRPAGSIRQLAAIAADGDRSSLLTRLRVPTQVIHGKADPLVPVAAAADLMQKISGAEVDLIVGMGHDLPEALWPRFVSGIATVAGRA